MQTPSTAAAFRRARAVIFGIVVASFVLSFVHRTAPAAIAGELTRDFAINSTVLGTLAATYFYVYTVLQIPVGVLADTLGPRWLLTGGSLVAAAGSFVFALAPTWEVAAAGRTLVGIGVSVAFLAILKVSAVWFAANRFATLNGVTLFAGNMGAVLAGAPLAWLVTWSSWRTVFVGLAVMSLLIGVASFLLVRDRPEDLGFAPIHAHAASNATRIPWMRALRDVLRNPATWPCFVVNLGTGGSFLAWAGLWAVPYLQDVYGVSRVVAAQHTSLFVLGVAVGSLLVGVISDRTGNRRSVMIVYTALYAASWLPWLVDARFPLWASHAWFLLMGLVSPAFVLGWTVVKEVNRPENSGIATSIANVGIFIGTGILQPLIGWLLDRGRAENALASAWSTVTALLFAFALCAAIAAFCVRGRR
jgi:sugar phosphate permease